jgi:hypothetical protein
VKLFVCIFDDAGLLPHFLRHYDRLGVSEFHVATTPSLAEEVSEAAAAYRASVYTEFEVAETVTGGVTAVAAMRDRAQDLGEWVVIVDLDEFVEVDGPLQDLMPELERENANVARGIMYDRFPADGRPTPFDADSDLPSLYPVRARFIRDVMQGTDFKGFLVKGHLQGEGAHHIFAGERVFSRVFEISHYKWDDPTLRRIKQALEMTQAAGLDWSEEYRRILEHYAEHGRFAWETFGGELVG